MTTVAGIGMTGMIAMAIVGSHVANHRELAMTVPPRQMPPRQMPPSPGDSRGPEGLDDAGFQELYKEFSGLVRRVIFRLKGSHDLDDLVQDAFVKAYASRASFQGQSTAKTWLTRIAVNTAIDSGRKAQVRKGTEAIEDVDALRGRSRDPALALAIQQAVAGLAEDWRAPFVLVVMEGFTAAEAATALGVKPGTVRSRVHRAREQVREALSPREPAAEPASSANGEKGQD